MGWRAVNHEIRAAPQPAGRHARRGFAAMVEGFVASDWMDPVVEEGSDRFAHFALAASQMALADAGVTEFDPLRTAIVIATSMGGTRALLRAQHLFESQGPEAVPRKVPDPDLAQHGGGPDRHEVQAARSFAHHLHGVCRFHRRGRHRHPADPDGDGGYGHHGRDGRWRRCRLRGGHGRRRPHLRNVIKGAASRFSCMPFDRDRTGIAGGEGSGFLILEDLEHAERRGATIKGLVAGYATAADAYHPSSPDPSGEWEALVIGGALEDAQLAKGRTRLRHLRPRHRDSRRRHGRDRAINAVYKDYESYPLVTSLKGAIGHSGGSAASLNMVAGIEGMQRGQVAPTALTKNVDPECNFDGGPRKSSRLRRRCPAVQRIRLRRPERVADCYRPEQGQANILSTIW